jgi:hypothetical protein
VVPNDDWVRYAPQQCVWAIVGFGANS